MRIAIIVTTLFWLAGNSGALAAGPFDGKWIADIPAQGKCNSTSTMTMIVVDGEFQGQIHNPRNVVPFKGSVGPDGDATLTINNNIPGVMKFTSNHFDATWPNSACQRHAEGDRAPDDAQQAADAILRKQKQDEFADLVRQANAGAKALDYTKLRSAYVFSKSWDFYDTKIMGILDQANAASKGDDCSTVLDKTSEIIAQDFTLAHAHTLRSDCLEKTDRAQSRVESDISDGLLDSLMDSGDGDSEKTAFVVSTYIEELEVLAKRHIQIKTRTTEVRGSDGHYYDEIQGISVNGRIYARTVYFNVDSFETGRNSKRAAIAVTTATIH